jgi:hypothetical protein
MKISGFTFVRNALLFDYPVVEAITSILPICDEVVVTVGQSSDATLDLIKSIQSKKIRIIETVWDDNLRSGGRVLAVETDKAFDAISQNADWAFYIQADEVLHEKYYNTIKENMVNYKDDPQIDGLLFNYIHFYGSYDYVGESFRWYRREIRVIKNNRDIFSYRDAQGFRLKPNKKLRVKHVEASIYHYGWVKNPKAMQGKQISFNKYWHDDQWISTNIEKVEEFDYSKIDSLEVFRGTHPTVMKKRIAAMNWKFAHQILRNKRNLKDQFKRFVERLTGWRPGE